MSNPDLGRWHSDDDEQHTLRDIFDIDGDGFVDWVDTYPVNSGSSTCPAGAGHWNVYRGSPAGFEVAPTPWTVPNGQLMCFLRQERVSASTNERFTDRLVVDVTGDGIADYVDASGPDWYVYPGLSSRAFRNWGTTLFGLGTSAQRSVAGVQLYGWAQGGTKQTRGLLDINGDGLPDLIDTNGGPYAPWTVYLNKGGVFAAPLAFSAPFGMLSYVVDGQPIVATVDLNGDGLPDQILTWNKLAYPNNYLHWEVFLHHGRAINGVVSEFWNPPVLAGKFSTQHVDSMMHTDRALLDVNGDGLLDLVDSSSGCVGSNSHWEVALNLGNDFAAFLPWSVPPGSCSISEGDEQGTHSDTVDIDGDGFLDRLSFSPAGSVLVWRNLSGAWCPSSDGTSCAQSGPLVAPANQGGGRDLLVQIENGTGGVTMMDYRPIGQWTGGRVPFNLWTLSRTELHDGMCSDPENPATCVGTGRHSVARDFQYSNQEFDPVEREFLGFGLVWLLEDPASGDGSNARATRFTFDNSRLGVKPGRLLSQAEAARNGGGWMRTIDYTWETPNITLSGISRQWDRLARIDDSQYGLQGTFTRSTVNVAWSTCANGEYNGHPAKSWSGDNSDSSQRVFTYGEHLCTDDTTGYRSRPKHVTIKAANDSTKLRESWYAYDSHGNLSSVEAYLIIPSASAPPACTNGTSGQKCVKTIYENDSAGNVTAIVDANNRRTEIAYEPLGIYPSSITYPVASTGAKPRKVATGHDPGCGTLLWRTNSYKDPDSGPPTDVALLPQTRFKYDQFCRLTKTANPDQDVNLGSSAANGPAQMFAYLLGYPGAPTSIWTVTREPNHPNGMLSSFRLVDALGRTIQSKGEQVVEGALHLVAQTATYDFRGAVAEQYVPFLAAAGAVYEPPSVNAKTSYQYDALGRVTQITKPDLAVRSYDYSVPRQVTEKDECYDSPTADCPGSKTVRTTNALGFLNQEDLYQGSTLKMRRQYVHNELGELMSTKQGDASTWNANTQITLTYDTLGRKRTLQDPDSGTWIYGYDSVGNLIFEEDPNAGQHMRFCYDGEDRLTKKCKSTASYTATSACDVGCAVDHDEYRYDDLPHDASDPTAANSVGRLTSTISAFGRTDVDAYDVRGRVLGSTQTVIGSPSATFAFNYDRANHIDTITYPGTDHENVLYDYDAAGQIETITGMSDTGAPLTYLANMTYDIFGRPRHVTHGSNVDDEYQYGDASKSFRLGGIITSGSPAGILQNLGYHYSKVGMLNGIDDVLHPSGNLSNAATLTYDGLGRLTLASREDTDYGYGFQNSTDNLSSIQLGPTSSTLTYSSTKPHQLTNAFSAAVTHDSNGNRKTTANGAYDFDAEDRLTHANPGGGASIDLFYGDGPTPIAKNVHRGTGLSRTTYFGKLAEVTDGWLTKYYYAGNLLIASQRVSADLLVTSAEDAVRFAGGGSGAQPRLMVLVRRDVGLATASMAAALILCLFVLPGRRKRVVGVVVHHGQVWIILLSFTLASLPIPIMIRPANAGGGGGATPTPTPAVSGGSTGVMHYHFDHLGSTQVITKSDGQVFKNVRYTPYGEPKHHTASGNPTTGCETDQYCRLFTGYTHDPLTGLYHAGARVYDPKLASFLTHDPLRQFANPYGHAGWNPSTFVDVDGLFLPGLGAAGGPTTGNSQCSGGVCLTCRGSTCTLKAPNGDAVSGTATGNVPAQGKSPIGWNGSGCSGIGCILVGQQDATASNPAQPAMPAAPDPVVTPAPPSQPVPEPVPVAPGRSYDLPSISWQTGLAFVNIGMLLTPQLWPVRAVAGGAEIAGALEGVVVEGTTLASRGIAGETLFEILDGVRRSKAAEIAGNATIEAEIIGTGGRVVEVPLSALRSPKDVIDTSGAGLSRWLSTLQPTLSGSRPPPILVQPGSRGIPIQRVIVQ